MKTDTMQIAEANRISWNASAQHHEETAGWQRLVEAASQTGFSTFDPTLTSILNEIGLAGKSVIQIGCNNGRETISLSSFGAIKCVGLDQSEAFIAQANTLAGIAKSDCTFTCANIYDLPASLRSDFDVALITIGVLNWMPDISRFFAIVAKLLKPGGQLVIYETHPYLEMYEPHGKSPFTPEESYFRTAPFVEEKAITYDGSDHEGTESYWFIHTMGSILNACIDAGLQITNLTEYPHSNREVDYNIYENQPAQIPLCFSLQARNAGS